MAGCQQTTQELSAEKVNFSISAKASDKVIFEGAAKVDKGTNAFQAMNQLVQTGYKQYPQGVFVESINGLRPAADEYWALYANGKFADRSIDSFSLDKDAAIEWKLEKVSDFQTGAQK